MTKTMIVYYSWSGRTAALAHQLQRLSQADTYELKVPAGTFSQDMYETSDLAKAQLKTGKLPAFTQPLPDLAGYDLILVGGPVWSGAPATPILSFLASANTGRAKLAPFYTDAGSAGDYETAFQQAAGNRTTTQGFEAAGPAAISTIQAWLNQL